MADVIASLPTDKIPPTKEENDILKWLFPKNEEVAEPEVQYAEDISNQIKENRQTKPEGPEKSRKLYSIAFILIITITFFMLNLNSTNGIFKTFFQTDNQYIFALMKTFLFLILFVSTIFVMKKINV